MYTMSTLPLLPPLTPLLPLLNPQLRPQPQNHPPNPKPHKHTPTRQPNPLPLIPKDHQRPMIHTRPMQQMPARPRHRPLRRPPLQRQHTVRNMRTRRARRQEPTLFLLHSRFCASMCVCVWGGGGGGATSSRYYICLEGPVLNVSPACAL